MALHCDPRRTQGAKLDPSDSVVVVLHRQSRVLRKCGQYQDLILLSAGEDLAFTYCDTELYGRAARKEGEPLFRASEDTENVRGRHIDYTLVLDIECC